AAAAAQCQLVDPYNAPRSNCCLVNTAKTLADQLQDWDQIGRYHEADVELLKQPFDPKRVVFMGDSITDGWRLEEYFPGKPYVNRGISGQVTAQMVVRMYPDVIALKPAAVAILAGTNDIARNNGPETAEMIEDNLMAMTDLAQKNGVKVLLCSIMPVSDYPYQHAQEQAARGEQPAPAQGGRGGRGMMRAKQTDQHPAADLLKINAWMKSYAAKVGATYVDYWSALVDDRGWMKDGISADGLHPNADGYKLIVPVINAALAKVVQ
ncbi:MAG TPA: SGNH/GDSL hydrolase family protein, partial [Bryobacteraceae bacterium]|nr:SGNH/GDSL hydrolase family protein [Bryobacteraceae bacterium]